MENSLPYVLFAIAIGSILFSSPVTGGEDENGQPQASNLEVIQNLALQVGDSLAGFLAAGDSVRVLVRPMETAWYVQGPILRAFVNHGQFPTESLSASSEVEVGLLKAKVEYLNPRRHGVFGPKVLDRTVSVEFAGKVVNGRSGVVVLNGNVARSASDTVSISEIGKLENAGIPATHGEIPPEGYFSSILEPLVMIGAVAVAIFLLFRVRS